jgi:hypothetical protein
VEHEESCLFLYGVVDPRDWTDAGDALRRAVADMPGVSPMGHPEVLVVGRLGVLVSRVPLAEFSGERFEANLEDVSWIGPRARAHFGVTSMAFLLQPVLPMRFGTLFSTPERMEEGLTCLEAELLEQLEAIRGLEEWTVRVCANPERQVEQAAAAHVSGDQAGRGSQYLLRRQMALKGRSEMTARLTDLAAKAHAALEPLACRVTAAQAEVSGLPGGQRSLVSRVYVIGRERRQEFLAAAERLGETLAREGLTLIHSGPWPPVQAGALA